MNIYRIACSAAFAVAASAQAAPIDWNTWSSSSGGSISTVGGPVAVSFAGPTHTLIPGYPTYTPSGTFADGVFVDNAPVAANGIMQLVGGNAVLNTLTFATAVVNPVMAIWSLGQPGINANFSFTNATRHL